MQRRGFLRSGAGLLTAAAADWLLTGAAAPGAAAPGAAAAALDHREVPPTPSDYARLKGLARTRAAQAYISPAHRLPPVIAALDWDHWQAIRFRDERSLWGGEGLRFKLQFAHPGYTLDRPVRMSVVTNVAAREILYAPALFDHSRTGIHPTAR